MFQPVELSGLHHNRKYKIIDGDEYTGIYKGVFWDYEMYLIFDEIIDSSGNRYHAPLYFLPTQKIYQFVSQKARIQSDMERRAVNQIVQRLTGDACFEW
jgi:hypothetical protein